MLGRGIEKSRSRQIRLAGLLAIGALVFLPSRTSAQVTESPVTVEPGHFLLKIDAVSLKLDRDSSNPAGTRYDALALGTTYLTTGISNRMDIQFGAEFFLREKVNTAGGNETHSGAGSVYVRPKWTFWIDPSRQALAAIMPWVKVPTGARAVTRKAAEGGVILPWQMFLNGGYRAVAMAEWDFVRNDDDNGYDSKWFASANLQHDIGRQSSFYAEATLSLSSAGANRSALNIGTGLNLQVTALLQVDMAIYGGLTSAAVDWNPIVRLRWRW